MSASRPNSRFRTLEWRTLMLLLEVCSALAGASLIQRILVRGHYRYKFIGSHVCSIGAHCRYLCSAQRGIHLHLVVDEFLALLASGNPSSVSRCPQELVAFCQSPILFGEQRGADL